MGFTPYTPSKKHIQKWFSEGSIILFVLNGKHGDHEVLIKSEDNFLKYCLSVLKDRLESEMYYINPEKSELPKLPSISKEEAGKASPKILREALLNIWELYEGELKYHEKNKIVWNSIQSALSNNDGWSAYSILSHRSGHEYEGIYVMAPEIV